jgi:hypothetical protein
MAVTLRSRQAVKLGAQTREGPKGRGGKKDERKKKGGGAVAAASVKLSTQRNAGVKKNPARRRSGRIVSNAALGVAAEDASIETPTKLSSQTLSLARGSTPLRVYSPRRQSQVKSPAKSASKPAKRASRKAATAQSTRSPKQAAGAKKKVVINVSQSSEQESATHFDKYVNDMKAYFADVDAYELKEES